MSTAAAGGYGPVARAPASVADALDCDGERLDPATQELAGRWLGHDFSRVRVHVDSRASLSARDLGARAYTFGTDMVFGRGEYAPTTAAGLRLVAHELAHVVQQSRAAPIVMCQQAQTATEPPGRLLDFDDLATRIHTAIEGLGTDEKAVYRALQSLDRNPVAIEQLKATYLRRFKVSLLEDINGDFSGTELEYALQLLNLGRRGSAQRIESRSEGRSDPTTAASRIREAVEGLGTDEEAIYATLLPFNRDTLALQSRYHELYGEDLRDRIEDEMSGSDLAHALDLLATPYENYLQIGNELLSGGILKGRIGFGLSWAGEGWYDRRFWKPAFDAQRREWKLQLIAGSPHGAIDALFDEQSRWHVDCAEFVEVVQLYALRHTLGAKAFDARVGDKVELRTHGSSGIRRQTLYSRSSPDAAMKNSVTGQIEQRPPDLVLDEAPIGSRVRWTSGLLVVRAQNLFGQEVFEADRLTWTAYQHENTVKLGADRFGAQGVGRRATYSRADVESELIDITKTVVDKPIPEIKRNIFVSEIEEFERPDAPTP